MERNQAKPGSIAMLIIFGIAFATFVFSTVILLAVNIESNARD